MTIFGQYPKNPNEIVKLMCEQEEFGIGNVNPRINKTNRRIKIVYPSWPNPIDPIIGVCRRDEVNDYADVIIPQLNKMFPDGFYIAKSKIVIYFAPSKLPHAGYKAIDLVSGDSGGTKLAGDDWQFYGDTSEFFNGVSVGKPNLKLVSTKGILVHMDRHTARGLHLFTSIDILDEIGEDESIITASGHGSIADFELEDSWVTCYHPGGSTYKYAAFVLPIPNIYENMAPMVAEDSIVALYRSLQLVAKRYGVHNKMWAMDDPDEQDIIDALSYLVIDGQSQIQYFSKYGLVIHN